MSRDTCEIEKDVQANNKRNGGTDVMKDRYGSRVNMLIIIALVVFILLFLPCQETWIDKTLSVPALYRQLPYNGIPYGGFCAIIMIFVFVCVFAGAASHRLINCFFRLIVFAASLATLLPLFIEARFFMQGKLALQVTKRTYR